MTDLLPCPFCGGAAKMKFSTFEIAEGHHVVCEGKKTCPLYCSDPYRPFDSEDEAARVWNDRTVAPREGGAYLLVPHEPTEGMYHTGYDATRLPDGTPQFANAGFCLGHAGTIYRAMTARSEAINIEEFAQECFLAGYEQALHNSTMSAMEFFEAWWNYGRAYGPAPETKP